MTDDLGPADAAHPGTDELADLSAGTLDASDAHRVADHVAGCAQCTDLLATADSVRDLLRAEPDDVMPDDVWERLEASLREEVAAVRSVDDSVAVRPTAALPSDAPVPLAAPRLRRPTSGGGRTRRQARSEDRDERLSRLPRLLAAAAAVVVLLGGLGFAATRLPLTGSSDSAATAAGGAAQDRSGDAESGGGSAPQASVLTDTSALLSTGTAYTQATVVAQVKALVARTDEAAAPRPIETPGQSATAQRLVRDPTALRGCLSSIYSEDLTPVAVDLGTWEGREAAIIVLPARDGGYEVWAVARTCAPGDDGTLFFTTIPPG